MSTHMMIRIESDLKERFARLARMEGKSTSRMIRDLVEHFIEERDIRTYMDDLWARVGGRLKSKGFKASDVSKAVRQVRQGR
jgi:predicted transcriptional regulator